jgi:hypothetical protein
MANFMARYRGGDGHYADVECAYGELERYLVLSSPVVEALPMKAERFAGHHEAREALVLSVAGVTAIMLIESLVLLILY